MSPATLTAPAISARNLDLEFQAKNGPVMR